MKIYVKFEGDEIMAIYPEDPKETYSIIYEIELDKVAMVDYNIVDSVNGTTIKYWNGEFSTYKYVEDYINSFVPHPDLVNWDKVYREFNEEYEETLVYKNGELITKESPEEEIKEFVLANCVITEKDELKNVILEEKKELEYLFTRIKDIETNIAKLENQLNENTYYS